MTWEIIQGNCLEVMADMDANSIDSIVCDPPYGLEFMNKGWDHGVPTTEYWQACLRVAKPGAHLLAFGGTRTYHRLACAIEDAGWIIRDCLMWITGQGFPKGHKVYCTCGEDNEKNTEHNMRSLQQTDIQKQSNTEDKSREVLQSQLQEQSAQEHRQKGAKSKTSNGKQPRMERGEIHRTRKGICDGKETGSPKGKKERICSGTHTGNGKETEQTTEDRRRSASHQPQQDRQQTGQSETVQKSQDTLGAGTYDGRTPCPQCGKITNTEYQGFNVALKPAYEPVILARKPFKGSVASNVLQHGTGALNIDGCRIEGEIQSTIQGQSDMAGNTYGKDQRVLREYNPHTKGRWPANLLLDEAAADMLDEQSGVSKSQGGGGYKSPCWTESTPDKMKKDYGDKVGLGDQGGASRFFYTSKSSKAEREGGLDYEGQCVGDGRNKSIDNPYQRGQTKRKNVHPTVKPIDLMRYLVKLVTPPKGIVLDPFAGSGSTIVAARIEGFDGIGIELEEQYCDIARKRIAHAGIEAGNATEDDAETIAGDEGKPVQIGLFR